MVLRNGDCNFFCEKLIWNIWNTLIISYEFLLTSFHIFLIIEAFVENWYSALPKWYGIVCYIDMCVFSDGLSSCIL